MSFLVTGISLGIGLETGKKLRPEALLDFRIGLLDILASIRLGFGLRYADNDLSL